MFELSASPMAQSTVFTLVELRWMARFTSPILYAGSEPPSPGLCWAMSTPGVWKSTW